MLEHVEPKIPTEIRFRNTKPRHNGQFLEFGTLEEYEFSVIRGGFQTHNFTFRFQIPAQL